MNLPGTSPREAVVRPDPGLARGFFEAPAWAFYAIVAAAIGAGVLWLLAILRSRRAGR